jgi:hypothetical protein
MKDEFKKIYVISGTEKINRFYSELTEEENIFDEFSEEWMMNLINKCTHLNANKKKEDMSRVLVVCDDILCDFRMHSSKALRIMTSRGRHFGCTNLYIFQNLTQISPMVRQNSDYVFCSTMSAAAVDMLENEFNRKLTKKQFMEMYNRICQNYQFLVISQNGTRTDDINEIYSIIKAPG